MLFQIKKQSAFDTRTRQIRNYFQLCVKHNNSSYSKIISVFENEENAKILLEKIKDLYPERNRTEEIFFEENQDSIRIIAEDELCFNTMKTIRSYAIFHNMSCKEIVYEDYQKAIEFAKNLVQHLAELKMQQTQTEIVYEVSVNRTEIA
jgi:hypothetical protein